MMASWHGARRATPYAPARPRAQGDILSTSRPRRSSGINRVHQAYAAEASATTQLPRPKAEALVSRESDMDWFVPYGIGFGLMVLAIFIGNALFGRKR